MKPQYVVTGGEAKCFFCWYSLINEDIWILMRLPWFHCMAAKLLSNREWLCSLTNLYESMLKLFSLQRNISTVDQQLQLMYSTLPWNKEGWNFDGWKRNLQLDLVKCIHITHAVSEILITELTSLLSLDTKLTEDNKSFLLTSKCIHL